MSANTTRKLILKKEKRKNKNAKKIVDYDWHHIIIFIIGIRDLHTVCSICFLFHTNDCRIDYRDGDDCFFSDEVQ